MIVNHSGSGGFVPVLDWKMQSAAKLEIKGDGPPAADAGKWYPVTVPCTVLAGLVENGEYPNLYFGENLKRVAGDRFASPWWYQAHFKTPDDYPGQQVWLYFQGINYRANIWLNGKKIGDAKDVVGTYRDFEFNVTDKLKPGSENILMVEVLPPVKGDLAITFVDWAPEVPDKNMGIWQNVMVRTSGPLALRYPHVVTDLDVPSLKQARLTAMVDVINATDHPLTGLLNANLNGFRLDRKLSQTIRLAAGETRTIEFRPDKYEQLVVDNPRVWWPYQLGKQEMYTLGLEIEADARPSDIAAASFGIRSVTSRLEKGKIGPTKNREDDHRLFTVNGVDLLITGGGYAPDLLQRRSTKERPNLQEDHIRYVKDMNLNTVRLEGKLEDDDFYNLCDQHGVLVMAGWCCCSPWEQWKNWKDEQHKVATESLRYQIRRARTHPSMLAWLNGSDNPPPKDVEQQYLTIEEELKWPCPTISSATAKLSGASEPTGVKMNGPYKWVPPIFWLTDKKTGGAWGFNSEVGPGAVPPPLESLDAMLPKENRWPMDSMWDYHCGIREFNNMRDFTKALDARFGPSTGIADFAWKAQAQAYETIRAMYEGFRANKWEATGEIQWMLNNAWPSMIWHLYDYYLRPGGSYFATKVACEPLHVLYRYDNGEIVVANDTLQSFKDLVVETELFDANSKVKSRSKERCNAPANSSTTVAKAPGLDKISTVYFLRLSLSDSGGKLRSVNSYWLSTVPDVMNYGKSDWATTQVTSFADYKDLQNLPKVNLDVKTDAALKIDDKEGTTSATVSNDSDAIALLVRAKLMKGDSGTQEVLPIRWSDNYFMLLPGEQREITARYMLSDLLWATPKIMVDCFNNGRG